MSMTGHNKTHTFYVTIDPHFPMSEREALDKIHSWLETYGHTSVGHGFDLKSVSIAKEKHRAIVTKEPS